MKLYTAAAVAKWLDMTDKKVRQLRNEKIISEYRPGLYDLKEVVKQYIGYLTEKNPEAADGIDYTKERAKLVRAKRESEELELQIRKRELHTTEDVKKVTTDTLVNFRTRLMAIPAKISPVVAKKTDQTEIFMLLKANIDEVLEELSDFDKIFAYEDEGEGKESEE
jgi:hypothetical protein